MKTFKIITVVILTLLTGHGGICADFDNPHFSKTVYPPSSDTGRFVVIGGIRQWISIFFENPDAPVLLFLHGGPGNPPTGTALESLKSLRSRFTVIIWHQRNSGMTLKENPSFKTVTTDLMFSDAVGMVEWISAQYHQPKIFLMGHSWGGYLALRLAGMRPDLIKACFAMSPMVAQEESERMTLDSIKTWVTVNSKKEGMKELSEIRIPFDSWRSLYLHRKWLALCSGITPTDEKLVREWSGLWLELFTEASQIDFRKTQPSIGCPVYFLVGRKDLQTHFRLAVDYYKLLKAPEKELVWFDFSGHAPHRSEPLKFRETVFRLSGQ